MNSVGRIVGINGNMVTVETDDFVTQNEVAYAVLDDKRLKSEVIRINGNRADLQVFESTNGLKVGDEVQFTGELLSVDLGPGILKSIYEGLQNPLHKIADTVGLFLDRGIYFSPLDEIVKWDFIPTVSVGSTVSAGDYIGYVYEGIYKHNICVQFGLNGRWTVEKIATKGLYTVKDEIAIIKSINTKKQIIVKMSQKWPVKVPIKCYKEKILPRKTLITQQRIIDTFFPIAIGGTFCTPGPFGAGKTVLQHALSQHAHVDIVVIAACGERAGEVVEILKEFPYIKDERTGRTLMERSVIICNTSSMPIAARESSVYTAITISEYYRQIGLNVLLLADSTSRWAQALREMSGRLEEIPGEEGFPAYLESRIAGFYERAGLVILNNGNLASITIGGAVSPAGGNFEEPVTQATLKVVGAFLGLSKDRAAARRFPSIHPLDSWSHYNSIVDNEKLNFVKNILIRGNEVNQMMNVVGEEGTSIDDFIIYLEGEFVDFVYLQQNIFDKVDGATNNERQIYMFDLIIDILKTEFKFDNKDLVRQFFMELRQIFVDLNYTPMESEKFYELENNIKNKIGEFCVSE